MFGFGKRQTQRLGPDKTGVDQSLELGVSADGQLSVSAADIQVSMAEVEAEIDAHLTGLHAKLAEQTTKIQPGIPDYDSAARNLERLRESIRSAESDKARKAYVRSFHNVAEAYDTLATTATLLRTDASASWEAAWDVLNKETLKVIIAVSQGKQDTLANDYVELLFARGIHCLRILKYAPDEVTRLDASQAALRMFYTYLLVIHKLGINHWQSTDAARNIHIAVALGSLSQAQLQSNLSAVGARSSVQSPNDALQQALRDVQAYELSDQDRQRLPTLIY